ncbi:hypothetical protein KEM48_009136 [Puccinia striiformis f. sp. tritici PST-130]|nr:hypothetical protein KEM48_009136 [Puccinia striiformis f. sp. tritici PST-130]
MTPDSVFRHHTPSKKDIQQQKIQTLPLSTKNRSTKASSTKDSKYNYNSSTRKSVQPSEPWVYEHFMLCILCGQSPIKVGGICQACINAAATNTPAITPKSSIQPIHLWKLSTVIPLNQPQLSFGGRPFRAIPSLSGRRQASKAPALPKPPANKGFLPAINPPAEIAVPCGFEMWSNGGWTPKQKVRPVIDYVNWAYADAYTELQRELCEKFCGKSLVDEVFVDLGFYTHIPWVNKSSSFSWPSSMKIHTALAQKAFVDHGIFSQPWLRTCSLTKEDSPALFDKAFVNQGRFSQHSLCSEGIRP